MYKGFNKGEVIVSMIAILFALVYRILADHASINLPAAVVFIVMFVSFGYLFFNRVVTLAIDAAKMRNKCFDTFLTIEKIWGNKSFGSEYKIFTASYLDAEDKLRMKTIHQAFSIRKWKVGDRIRIKVSREDPEKIIIPSSDIFLAVLMSLLGIAAETAAVAIFILALKNR